MKKTLILLAAFFPILLFAQYTGTGSVTQGLATTTAGNLYTCTGGRITNIGLITATDNTVWTVPAEVNFINSLFPAASNLNNPCTGANYTTDAAALAALSGSDIVEIDSTGEVITAFVFADNYFEMYINGVPVGKDNVPYTQFNSNIIRFRVNRPFTVAMLLVDWEEHLGLGSEVSNGFQYHNGDGGMVAVFKDASNAIISITDSDWKAQTFYTAPITDLTCPTENGTQRISSACSTQDSNNGIAFYGLHWNRPANWMNAGFDDSTWPAATTYTNATIGVNNKPAYTNFTNIFDDPSHDGQFIWSTNVILDNEVIVRHTVDAVTAIPVDESEKNEIQIYPNPANNYIQINRKGNTEIKNISIYSALGQKIYSSMFYSETILVSQLPSGIYFVKIEFVNRTVKKRFVVE